MGQREPDRCSKIVTDRLQFGELTEAARRIYAIPGKVHGVLFNPRRDGKRLPISLG